jgi:plastocyanin
MALLASVVLAAAGCGGGGGGDTTTGPPNPTPPTTANTVTVNNNFFSPQDLTVTTGATVTWQWAAGSVGHNVTFDDGVKSETLTSGTFPRTFSAAGTYPYHCTIHGLAMHGTVTVSASGGSTGGSGGGGGGGGGYDYSM